MRIVSLGRSRWRWPEQRRRMLEFREHSSQECLNIHLYIINRQRANELFGDKLNFGKRGGAPEPRAFGGADR